MDAPAHIHVINKFLKRLSQVDDLQTLLARECAEKRDLLGCQRIAISQSGWLNAYHVVLATP